MKQRDSGMTGTQVLVIIVLIGTLLALGSYELAKAKERGRRANCVSNLKQLGTGFGQYFDDHSNRPPPMTSVQVLVGNLLPFNDGSVLLFICPSDKSMGYVPNRTNLTESSYAFVTNAIWQSNCAIPLTFDKLRPSGLTMLTGTNTWSRKSTHGRDGGNVLWTDGHVEFMRELNVGYDRYPVVND